jgi:hypothetical protein
MGPREAHEGAHFLQLSSEGMAVRANRQDRAAVLVLGILSGVLTLSADAPLAALVRGDAAHHAAIIEARPHFVDLFPHRIVGALFSIVLFQIDDAKLAPRHASLALTANDLEGVVIRIPLDDDATLAAVTRSMLKCVEFALRHKLSTTHLHPLGLRMGTASANVIDQLSETETR